ncbi:MAG: hypothetical protein E5W15_35775, partial [Mesorhizobium sp.]|nr:hypothetical protein EJ068_27760 [Mesorhizobium sp. M2A.F.Ca.ET.043.02.1.1]RUW42155.1 hypothetical protein EOA37_06625 [Mesorhizobium sp. M2A.F.Ca.ET.015.02.1.1]RUW69858.1 hypothetical protein EOA28_24765 [Mesorhizobium sp. M2A.F.Ca.ET.067.02.1.1]RVC94619.1 hypothetical protein EN739_16470 [Mesorhizobium sp. M2A.F.Ca.ET.017.03.2.1]RVC97560.1 hypothetical protein EN753_30115 [Mesorhizobium sp. M2A.F.Ca.ET.029.05.1.1]RWB41076.1 MAG: hypothetical protein EOQ46_22950 [Mesorhizobium sp.]
MPDDREAGRASINKFIALHKGDPGKALKEMIVLNGHLQRRLDALPGTRQKASRRREKWRVTQ